MLDKLPNNLIITLKRFEYDMSFSNRFKVNDYIEFPLLLNLKPWSTKREEQLEDESYYEYELVGVVVHSGMAEAGHYYSFIKERNPGHPNFGQWFKFNDKNVSKFDINQLADECFGGEFKTQDMVWNKVQIFEKIRNAYLLFYKRIQQYPYEEE